jgi:hypothetical protein
MREQRSGPGFVPIARLAQKGPVLRRADHAQHLGRDDVAAERDEIDRRGPEHRHVAAPHLARDDEDALVQRTPGERDREVVAVERRRGDERRRVLDVGAAQHGRIGRIAAHGVAGVATVVELGGDDDRLHAEQLEMAPQGARERAEAAQQPASPRQLCVVGRFRSAPSGFADHVQAGVIDSATRSRMYRRG